MVPNQRPFLFIFYFVVINIIQQTTFNWKINYILYKILCYQKIGAQSTYIVCLFLFVMINIILQVLLTEFNLCQT